MIVAAEKAGLRLFLGSYPITPATDILHELSKHKELGVITVQAEDEIAGICTSIGASFAGCLAATSTSGPGLALKSEAIGLAVIAELPLVVIDVQRGGPSTGMPTKSEQTDLMQALYGRNGESPAVVIAASTPTDCFDAAYWAGKLALEHMTPVILLTDAFIANGSSAWKLPNLAEYPEIKPNYVSNYDASEKVWKAYRRDKESLVRYWAIPGTEALPIVWAVLKKTMKQVLSHRPRQPPEDGYHPPGQDRQDCRLYPRTGSDRRPRCRPADRRMGRNIRTPLRSNGNYAGAGKEGCSGSLQVHQSAA